MAEYQLIANSTSVTRRADGAVIPDDPANRDRAEYTAWVEAGGVPDPPPPPSRQGVIVQSQQALSFSQAKSLNAQGRTQEAVDALITMLEPKP